MKGMNSGNAISTRHNTDERLMEIHYCWRCDAKLPFLDETEYCRIAPWLGVPVPIALSSAEWKLLDQLPLDLFESITGYRLHCRGDIYHHRLARMGPKCDHCGHLLRSPNAAICAHCWRPSERLTNTYQTPIV